jgi:hypothetical protein
MAQRTKLSGVSFVHRNQRGVAEKTKSVHKFITYIQITKLVAGKSVFAGLTMKTAADAFGDNRKVMKA